MRLLLDTHVFLWYITANPKASPKEIVAGLASTGMKIKIGLANSLKYARRKPGRRASASGSRAQSLKSPHLQAEQIIKILLQSLVGYRARGLRFLSMTGNDSVVVSPPQAILNTFSGNFSARVEKG